MTTFLLSLILLVNNRNFINLVICLLIVIVYISNHFFYLLEAIKLLFNSSSHQNSLTVSIILISSLVIIWLVFYYGEIVYNNNFKLNNEFVTLFILLLIGLSGLVATNNYLVLFVSIELQSLVLYILFATNITAYSTFTPLTSSFESKSEFESESSIVSSPPSQNIQKAYTKHEPTRTFKGNFGSLISKVSLSYLINAATVTALLLFGISINSPVLILVAILWKLGVIPTHAWSIPILDNVHSLIISIYLTIAKYGTLTVIAYVSCVNAISSVLLNYVGILNLTIGNILGLFQSRYQRIIVYSSLIQIGYMLLVLSNLTSLALGYFELYSFYTVMLLLLWTLPNYNSINTGRLLARPQVWTIVLIFYTVAGLPYFSLFWTKLDILLAIQTESLVFALISTLLSSLIYIRLIKSIVFFQYTS